MYLYSMYLLLEDAYQYETKPWKSLEVISRSHTKGSVHAALDKTEIFSHLATGDEITSRGEICTTSAECKTVRNSRAHGQERHGPSHD